MCSSCQDPKLTFEQYIAEISAYNSSNSSGGCFIHAEAADPPLPSRAYTVGLSPRRRPELVLSGLPFEESMLILAAAADLPVTDTVPGERFTLDEAFECVAVVDPRPRLHVAEALYGPHIQAVQLVYPDHHGMWPWDSRYSGEQILMGPPGR